MISADSEAVIRRGKEFYDRQLRGEMERDHDGKFLTLDPETGRYWLGGTFDEAVNSALDDAPETLTYTLQIGRRAPLHVGVWSL